METNDKFSILDALKDVFDNGLEKKYAILLGRAFIFIMIVVAVASFVIFLKRTF